MTTKLLAWLWPTKQSLEKISKENPHNPPRKLGELETLS